MIQLLIALREPIGKVGDYPRMNSQIMDIGHDDYIFEAPGV